MSSQSSDPIDLILESAVARHLSGEVVDIEALALQHAEHAEVIRSRWRAIKNLRDPLGPMLQPSAAHDAKLVAGSTIGNFEIIREIGRGGMGVVYEARQKNPARSVAIKVIRGAHFVDDHALRMFQREITALARLRHQSIAAIYEAGATEDGQHYFAMELVEGIPLKDFARRTDLPRKQRLDLFIRICDAANYANQRGVIHRDLKPANILIETGGNPKVLDFGLARITDADVNVTTAMTNSGRIQGTLAYMSPEQAMGQTDQIDVRTDVYSLGVILHELLTGSLPHELAKSSIPQAVRTICEEPPRRLSMIDRSLRGDLETIVLKALERESSRRYQSVAALAEDIQRFSKGQPILARPTRIHTHILKAARRKPIHVILAGTAALVLILGVLVARSRMEAAAAREEQYLTDLKDKALYYVHASTYAPDKPNFTDEVERDRREAENCLDECIRLEPRSPWGFLTRAYLRHTKREDREAVLADIEWAHSLAPKFTAPLALEFCVRSGDGGSQPTTFDWTNAPYPVDVTDLYFCGMTSIDLGDFERARTFLSAVLEIQPTHYWARLARVRCFEWPQESEARIADARLCLQLRPELLPSWLTLATWLKLDGKSEESLEILKQALARFPDNLLIIARIAEGFEGQGRLDDAEAWLRKAVKQDRTGHFAGQLGTLLIKRRKSEEGLQLLDLAIKRDNSEWHDNWILSKVRCLEDLGRVEEARSLLSDVSKSSGDYTKISALFRLAQLERNCGNGEAALKLFRDALELEHRVPTVAVSSASSAAQTLVDLGRGDEAEQLLTQELEWIGNKHGHVKEPALGLRNELARLNWRRGQGDRALELFNDLIRKNPSSPRAYMSCGHFLLSVSRPDIAMTYYSMALGLDPTGDSGVNQTCRWQIASCLRQLDRPAEALDQYALADATPVKEKRGSEDYYLLPWAELLLSDQAWTQEQEALHRQGAILRERDHPEAANWRGIVAINVLEKYVRRHGDSLRCAMLRGDALERVGRLDEAIGSYESAMRFAVQPNVLDSSEDWTEQYSRGVVNYRRKLLMRYCDAIVKRDNDPHAALEVCNDAIQTFSSPEWKGDAYLVSANLLIRFKRYSEAVTAAQSACALLPKDEDALTALGDGLMGQGEERQAINYWMKAVDASPLVSHAETRLLMHFCRMEADVREAIQGYELAKKWFDGRNFGGLGTRSAKQMMVVQYTMLVMCSSRADREDEALAYCREWQESVREASLPKESLANNIRVFEFAGITRGQAALIEECFKLRESLGLDADGRGPADALRDSAQFLAAKGEYVSAEALLQRAITIREKQLGPDEPELAGDLLYLFELYVEQGEYTLASDTGLRVLRIREQSFGKKDPSVAKILTELAGLAHERGEFEEAEKRCIRALRIYKSKLFFQDQVGIAAVQVIRGWIHLAKREPEKAEPLLRESLAARRKSLPKDDWRIANTESLLGGCLSALGRFEEAEPLLLNSYPRIRSDVGIRRKRGLETLERLVRLYEAWGKPDQAAEYRSRLADELQATPLVTSAPANN